MSNPFFQVLVGQNEEALKGLEEADYEHIVTRSIALQNLGKFEDSFKMIEKAIATEPNRFEAYHRRGLLNFYSGKIQQAKLDFELSLNHNHTHTQSQQFLKKCESELNNPKLEQTKEDKTIQHQELQKNVVSSGRLIYKWYQTDLKVGIEIHQSLSNKDQLKCAFQKNRLQLSFPLEDGSLFDLDVDLYGEILPDTSKAKVNSTSIEIILDKANKKLNWPSLDKVEKAVIPEQASYPSSSKVKKDWTKIDKEIEEDMSKHKEEYGEDPLNVLFKQIYQNGDENTRRAMVKSMQTSGGTVLSTNWDEVAKKDYEKKDRPSPPKGQEYKKMG